MQVSPAIGPGKLQRHSLATVAAITGHIAILVAKAGQASLYPAGWALPAAAEALVVNPYAA